jgi:uncharacterized phosphosugar-binding protein
MNSLALSFQESPRQRDRLFTSQREPLEQAASWLAAALINDHWLYAFGTGHSHLLAEEVFYRAGGLARAVPMLDENLMLHERAIEATHVERREGYARDLLGRYPVETGDLLLVASNSGRNAVPTELTLLARERGLKTVAITNFAQSRAWPSRHSSGKRLMDAADLAIDNCGLDGDACVPLPGLKTRVGSTSTVTGAFIINAIIVRGIELALASGHTPEIYISSNTDGDDHNDRLLHKYKSRIRHL